MRRKTAIRVLYPTLKARDSSEPTKSAVSRARPEILSPALRLVARAELARRRGSIALPGAVFNRLTDHQNRDRGAEQGIAATKCHADLVISRSRQTTRVEVELPLPATKDELVCGRALTGAPERAGNGTAVHLGDHDDGRGEVARRLAQTRHYQGGSFTKGLRDPAS